MEVLGLREERRWSVWLFMIFVERERRGNEILCCFQRTGPVYTEPEPANWTGLIKPTTLRGTYVPLRGTRASAANSFIWQSKRRGTYVPCVARADPQRISSLELNPARHVSPPAWHVA
ncbi:hypothetical protein A2U01_0000697 [Trifolium medium]|uniref:Uncharacterized protein n=1 Tax=Trifolium medium TaxID=97028 RepID=A0A392LYF5_9FABA|nr:hypothetical protein [Trifolium medium]